MTIDPDEPNLVAGTGTWWAFYVTDRLSAGKGAGAAFLSELFSC